MQLLRRGCVVCGADDDALCLRCARDLRPPPATSVRGVGPVPALFAYEGRGAQVVQALKFRDGRRLVGPLADGLTGLVGAGLTPVVTWIPTSPSRRRARGFDQAELLARAVARRLDVACRPSLHRLAGPSQTGRSRAERAVNVAFRPAAWLRRHGGTRLVVIDDVCTTGATVRAAAAVLGPCADVVPSFLVVARTP